MPRITGIEIYHDTTIFSAIEADSGIVKPACHTSGRQTGREDRMGLTPMVDPALLTVS